MSISENSPTSHQRATRTQLQEQPQAVTQTDQTDQKKRLDQANQTPTLGKFQDESQDESQQESRSVGDAGNAGNAQRSTSIGFGACGAFTDDGWFEVQVRVQPHHTDYAGIVWHGTYVTWMETVRVECLRALGVGYEDLVQAGCDLPVVDLTLRYHRSLRLGALVSVRARLEPVRGVRLGWLYELSSPDRSALYVTGRVTLVTLDRERGRILRRLPDTLTQALTQLPT